jgi:hypothetical protein
MLEMVFDVIKQAFEAGVKIKVITTDMGSENTAMWKLVKVYRNRTSHNCLIPSPCEPGEHIVFMPDPPHAIKNLKGAAMQYLIGVPTWFFEKYHLQDLDPNTTHVDLKKTILDLIEIQKEQNVVYVDGLTESHVFPIGFEKMRMKFTLKIIDSKVVAAIELCVANGTFMLKYCYK